MASIKKFSIIGIFISILSIFLMSQNVSAITPVIDLNNYTVQYTVYNPAIDCTILNAYQSVNSGQYCDITIGSTTATRLDNIQTQNTYSVKKGDLLNFYLLYYSRSDVFSHIPVLNVLSTYSAGWEVVSYQNISKEDFAFQQFSSNGHINWSPNNDFGIDFNSTSGFYRIYEITLRARQDNNISKFGLVSNGGLFLFNSEDYGQTVRFFMRYFTLYRSSESQENKEVEEKTQEAVDDSQNAGSSSSSSAQQGGASLLSAITGFFGVITSASPTSCVFNAPLNTYFGNQRLNVDLCALDLPSEIGGLTSIIAIGILIPFAIHMFNKFIALFRSFQS